MTAFELEIGETARFGDLADYIQELSNLDYTRPRLLLSASVSRLSLNRPGDRVVWSETFDAALLDDKRCDGALAERLASICEDPLRPCERVLVVAGKDQLAAPMLEVLGLLQSVAPSRTRAVELYQRRGKFEPQVGDLDTLHEQSFKESPPVRLVGMR